MAATEIMTDLHDRKLGLDVAGNLILKTGGNPAWGSTPVELTASPAELNELAGSIPAVAVAAAGTGQSTFTALTSRSNAVTGADGTKGVALPAAATTIGQVLVINTSATAVLPVAPINAGNDAINGLTAGTGVFSMAPGEAIAFIPTSATQWYTRHAAGQTPGTVTASLPLIADANKDLTTLRNVGVSGQIQDANGNEQIKFATTASAVNELTVTNAATGNGPTITVTGGDTNAPVTLAGKGTGAVILGQATSTDVRLAADQPIGDSSGNELLKFTKAATAVNEVTVANAATGNHPSLAATGGDTNINLALAGKGTGAVASTSRVTTTDGVASGTVKVVGGRATANVSAADTVTAVASNNTFIAFATTYSIPASTLNLGSVLKAKALVVVNDASGTDTLTVELRIGGTTLVATTAVDPGATTDLHLLEFEFTARAAAGAAASCVGAGRWITNTGGTIAHGTGLLNPTNFATNGALTLDVRAKWSSNTASTSARLEMLNVEIH